MVEIVEVLSLLKEGRNLSRPTYHLKVKKKSVANLAIMKIITNYLNCTTLTYLLISL
jgi:hypothetical protein